MVRPTVPRCGDDSHAPGDPRLGPAVARRNEAAVLIAARVIVSALLFGLHVNAADDALRRIEDRFLAPCCWQQSVAVHDSDIAKQMRAEIAGMVADGKNEEQIVDVYVARYGERILREPRGGYWWWSVMVPTVSIILAATGLVFFLRRLQKPPILAADATDLPPLPDLDLD